MSKFTLYIGSTLILGTLLLLACENSHPLQRVELGDKLLEIGGVENSPEASGKGFVIGDSIGVALFLRDPYRQIGPVTKYVHQEVGKWVSNGVPLKLTHNDAYTVCAFYPYNRTITDIDSIPAHTGLADFMWAQTEVMKEHSHNKVLLKMRQALAQVSFHVLIKDYNGSGEYREPSVGDFGGVTPMPVKDSIYYYNARDGKIDLSDPLRFPTQKSIRLQRLNQGGTVTDPTSGTLDKSDTTFVGELKLAPIGFGRSAGLQKTDFKFEITIDGQLLSVVLPVPSDSMIGYPAADGTLLYGWEAGKHYKYTITLTAHNLSVGGITVIDWEVVIDLDDVRTNVSPGDWEEGGDFDTKNTIL